MADLTPAGNPAGRFPAEKHAALDAVFTEASPFLLGEVEILDIPGRMSRPDALVWALGELTMYFHSNFLSYNENKTASELAAMWGVAAGALDKVIQALKAKEDIARFGLPEQTRDGLTYFARQEAKKAGGFPNYPLEIDRIVLSGEEIILEEFHEDQQLDQNIKGIFQILRWARQAEELAKLASRRQDTPEKMRTEGDLARAGMERGWVFDICDEIFDIWTVILGRRLGISVSFRGRKPTGPLIRFTQCCLKLIGHEQMCADAIRYCVRKRKGGMAKSGGKKI